MSYTSVVDELREYQETLNRERAANGNTSTGSRSNGSTGSKERTADAKPKEPIVTASLAADVAAQDTPPIRSYSTGFPDLDALIGGGISTRQETTLIAPPGAGKTAWAVSVALTIERELPILYASTELEAHELMARFAGNVLDEAWSAIARGRTSRGVLVESLRERRLYLLGCDVVPPDGFAALEMIEREAKRVGELHSVPPLVIVDYLQDLARGTEKDLRARTGNLATAFRRMSQRLDCPLLVVSSVGRAYYSPRRAAELRELDEPTAYLAAAKESGDVDYASAVVLFLDVEDDQEKSERAVRIAVAKSRHGRPGFAGARFAGASGRYRADATAASSMSEEGREDGSIDDKLLEEEDKVVEAVKRMHARGERDLATLTQLRTRCGFTAGRVKPAFDRAVHNRRLLLVTIEREEGDPPKKQKRQIYDLPGCEG